MPTHLKRSPLRRHFCNPAFRRSAPPPTLVAPLGHRSNSRRHSPGPGYPGSLLATEIGRQPRRHRQRLRVGVSWSLGIGLGPGVWREKRSGWGGAWGSGWGRAGDPGVVGVVLAEIEAAGVFADAKIAVTPPPICFSRATAASKQHKAGAVSGHSEFLIAERNA